MYDFIESAGERVKIKGYWRPDGKFGIRNHVLILPCSLCASETARFAADNVEGAVYMANQGGCSLSKRDLKVTLETLSGVAANPNVYGTIVIGNGCEVVQASLLAEKIREKTCKPLEVLVIREEEGSLNTAARAAKLAEKMRKEADQLLQEEGDVSQLILGTECGGSDPTSGLAANPVVGCCSDILIDHGGTVILSETPEMIGAEQILAERCETRQIKDKLLSTIKSFEEDFLKVGENPRSGNPTPGNIAGGITTLEEKSLGCIHKGGSRKIREVVDYGESVTKKGLVVMDTPGQDVASIVGMAAGGAQIAVFTTGHGTPAGSGIIPVIKITANEETARKMRDHIDFDCSDVLTDGKDMKKSGEELFQFVVETACMKETKAEKLGFQDVSIARYCNFA